MINLIVATHGEMSKYVVELSKMVLGDYEMLDFVTFLPGEGTDDLVKKYKEIFEKNNNLHGYLFLVDIFGGSPYNAASIISAENENMDIITGVNVPMLLELLDARENTDNLKELVDIAIEAGKSQIKSFKEILSSSKTEINNNEDDFDDLGEL
ncbi:MAG: PTS mannose transporter subunit IID [Fusobacteriaceae bacterium]|nr:PTS mannose transporter subunit IID [Fusobacteriaceae bacterium]MBN2838948.1 PTS mannose transporter subunit IID [Fusobacteriaceae bacterium]